MNTLLFIALFIVALPFSVWVLANLLGLWDGGSRSIAVTRLVVALCIAAVALLLTHRDQWLALAGAFGVVLLAHALSGWWLRARSLGAEVYVASGDSPQADDVDVEADEVRPDS